MNPNIDTIAAYADRVLPLASASLGDEYFYQSLPLCIIDAVYSIGVRYEGVRNVVSRYCTHYDLGRIRSRTSPLPQVNEQESVTAFCEKMKRNSPAIVAENLFCNRQRTSARNGILKAEAVHRFASVLKMHGVEHLQDVSAAVSNPNLARDILAIPGQRSGISLRYFFMLSGSDGFITPDRMILGFLKSALGMSVGVSEAQALLVAVTEQLIPHYPQLTPRLLDHEIWKYQRDQQKSGAANKKPVTSSLCAVAGFHGLAHPN